MKNKRERLGTTTNSRAYKMLLKRKLISYQGKCFYCPPNGGCNGAMGNYYYRKNRNWKNNRKTQWKEKAE